MITDAAVAESRDGSRPPVGVIVGEHEAGTRVGVRGALETGGFHVLAEATSAEEALAAATTHRPAVCLLAVHLPGGGIVAAERIKAALPDTKIVMLTGSDRDEDLFESIHAGAGSENWALGAVKRTRSGGCSPR